MHTLKLDERFSALKPILTYSALGINPISAPDQFLLDAYSNIVSKVVDRDSTGLAALLILVPRSLLTD